MGWTFVSKPKDQKTVDYFKAQWTFENDSIKHEIIDGSIIHFTEGYFACKVTNKDTNESNVYCLTCRIQYRDDYYNLGYKDMPEYDGPYLYKCPARIMKKLTPIVDRYKNSFAESWRLRQDCVTKKGVEVVI